MKKFINKIISEVKFILKHNKLDLLLVIISFTACGISIMNCYYAHKDYVEFNERMNKPDTLIMDQSAFINSPSTDTTYMQSTAEYNDIQANCTHE